MRTTVAIDGDLFHKLKAAATKRRQDAACWVVGAVYSSARETWAVVPCEPRIVAIVGPSESASPRAILIASHYL